ncbi:CHAT domain-containing protein [Lactarius akahatsu]|uniref:CHAT domain-containing protein n=1 Tax=Lactarius akahatsu TaxID=416441 RepID=A0AAD4LEM0_9AGAM|nr:CHAT domain-containing protein [Lactarius akahatsu]
MDGSRLWAKLGDEASSFRLPSCLPNPNRPNRCQATHSFSFPRTGPWDLNNLVPRSGVSSHALALVRLARYKLLQQKEDLDKCILHYAEAILLPPASWDGPSLNIVDLLFYLASFLLLRSENFEQPEDVKYSIEYLRYLRGIPIPLDSFVRGLPIPLDSLDHPRNLVTKSLIKALALQVKLEEGDGTRNIKEMVDLCCELLPTKSSTDDLAAAFSSLNEATGTQFSRGWTLPSIDEIIECLRGVVKTCSPDSYQVLFMLAKMQYARFTQTHLIGDYEEATVLLERILDTNQPSRCPDSIRGQASSLIVHLELSRLTIFKNPLHSEATIPRLRTLLSSSSIDEGLRLEITAILAGQARQRFIQYSLTESLEEANSYTSQVANISSSQNLEILEERDLTSQRVPQRPGKSSWYSSKFSRTNDVSDIEESIKHSRLLLDATYSGDWRVSRLYILHDDLVRAFKPSSSQGVHGPSTFTQLGSLRRLYFPARTCLGGIEDSLEAIRLISMVIDDPYAQEPDRFQLACQWVILARNINHPITFTAYKSAMLLLQKSFSFAPTVSVQHARLVAMGEFCQAMPLDYASFQIELGRLEEALRYWSKEERCFEDPPLAKIFAEVNRQLEALIISVTPSGRPEMEDGVAQGGDGTDPFGRLVVKRQNLIEERDALISHIRGRPGLERFSQLKTPSFTTLRSAASCGPVIIINHCIWRSDILIIFHNSLPCTIPTANGFYARANKLRDELVQARKHGLDSSEYQDALYPVIKKLRLLGVPEQSRIWWCPTSVFCSLPLHAMGPVPSSGTSEERYFSDLYILSYTPSLSALIESRKASRQTLEKPSLLLVAQPDDSLLGVKGEIKAIRSLEPRVTVANLISSEATPSSVVEGLRGNRFAHFACHGVLETGKPFETSFKLHGGSRLTLLDVARSRLPDAEFAFLSCCHAAEITQDSVADEALHLTAAMQYCGFRSVVGTMWEMADTDGRDLAKSFYRSLFSSQETSVPYYERSAGALRDTTWMLRRKRGITLERWVNFVLYHRPTVVGNNRSSRFSVTGVSNNTKFGSSQRSNFQA